ncbi:hypothetical protein LTR10_010474 [Elasticomyces elasticus]|nr:hypothetical protein LTR10_010474 [Elasticomyces elasticus]KAK4972373.1 hypothetical protein LTR42_006882 [Elasticomyces elasticus]
MASIQELSKVAKDDLTPTNPVVEQEVKDLDTTECETVPLDFSSLTIDENERNGVKRKITLDITYTKGVKIGKTQLFVEYADGQGREPSTPDPVNRYPGPEACRRCAFCQ